MIKTKEAQETTGKNWLSLEEACRLLMISKRTLQTYRDLRILPFSQIGRKIYFKSSDIEDYLTAHYIKLKKVGINE